MKTKEVRILDLFTNSDVRLTSNEIKNRTGMDDPSQTIKDLIYFEYLFKDEERLGRTSKR